MAGVVGLMSGSLLGSPAEMLIWWRLNRAVHGDAASREQSITTSDMCQVYYVRGFIELIYFVADGFNQSQLRHAGRADGGGHLYWSGFGTRAIGSLGGNSSAVRERRWVR